MSCNGHATWPDAPTFAYTVEYKGEGSPGVMVDLG